MQLFWRVPPALPFERNCLMNHQTTFLVCCLSAAIVVSVIYVCLMKQTKRFRMSLKDRIGITLACFAGSIAIVVTAQTIVWVIFVERANIEATFPGTRFSECLLFSGLCIQLLTVFLFGYVSRRVSTSAKGEGGQTGGQNGRGQRG